MVEGGHLVEGEKQEAERQVRDVEERVDNISSREAELRASEEV